MVSDRNLSGLFVVLGTGLLLFLYRINLRGVLLKRGTIKTKDDWRRLGPSPAGEERYPPQGMTVTEKTLLVTNHWNGAKSGLYEVDKETGEVLSEAVMPPGARHTSGLTWDGEWLWAVDHESNLLYKIDIEQTFDNGDATKEAVVVRRFDTGLRGASGLTILEIDGAEYLVISDFLWTIETTPSLPIGSAQTYIVPLEKIEAGFDVRTAASHSYRNGGYSQGLTWDGTYLYESLNNLKTDRIEVLELSSSSESGREFETDRLGSFEGPAGRIEDLGTDGDRLWTTDERTYCLYLFDALDEVRDRVA